MKKVLVACYLMYSALLFIALMLIALPFVLLASTLFNQQQGKRTILTLLRCWAWAFSIPSFFWIKTSGRQMINTAHPHIYVGNHGSYLDAIAVCISIPQYFSPLGKIEMTKVPIFGLIYKRIVVMIDRSSKESRETSVLILKEEIRKGQSILIFPEGTMNKSQQPLSDFYDGAFRLAIETQTPLIPFVMVNNSKLLPRVHPLKARPGVITTLFLPAVAVTGYGMEDVALLKQKVYTLMEDALIAYK